MDPYILTVEVPFKLFVYGILRGGRAKMWSHTSGLRPKLLAQEVRTEKKYRMVANGIAYVQEGGEHSILGDVYLIKDAKAVSLHIHPMEVGAGYELKRIEVPGHENVWAYFDRRGHEVGKWGNKLVKNGDYLKYREARNSWQF